MSRWSRIIRGMLGTGLTFSVGVGIVGSVLAAIGVVLAGGGEVRELAFIVFASAVWAFPMGVAFSGVLALTARGRSFDELSLPRFAALGAGAGLLLFGALALDAWDVWSPSTALVNAGLFVVLGGGSATATLMLARKAGPALESGDDDPTLDSRNQRPTREPADDGLAAREGPSVAESPDEPSPREGVDPVPARGVG